MAQLVPEMGFLKAETESTYGTDPNTDPVNLIMTQEPDIPVPSRTTVTKPIIKPDGSRQTHAVVDEMVEFSFQTVVATLPDTDGATPSLRPVLLASGHSESTSGTASGGDLAATYTPTRTGISSATFKFYVRDKDSSTDWIKIVITGARCTFDIDYSLDSRILVNVSGMGQFASWNDFADVSAETPSQFHQGEDDLITQDSTFTQGGNSKVITDWTFALNNSLNPINDVTATSKLKEVRLDNVNQGPGGSLNPLVESVRGTSDQLQQRAQATENAMNLDVVRGTDEWHFTASNTQISEDPSFSNEDAFYRYDSSYVVNQGSPEYELQWKETS